jgi:hypothetical protein
MGKATIASRAVCLCSVLLGSTAAAAQSPQSPRGSDYSMAPGWPPFADQQAADSAEERERLEAAAREHAAREAEEEAREAARAEREAAREASEARERAEEARREAEEAARAVR